MTTAPGPVEQDEYVLTLSCPDVAGIVRSVAGFLVEIGATITASQQFGDRQSGTFFMRVQFAPVAGTLDVDAVTDRFAGVADPLGMTWRLVSATRPTRTLIMVSTAGHCLNDLLYRTSVGGLRLDVGAVVGNHTDLEPMARHHGVPFHHVPVTRETKPQAESRLLDLVAELDIELVVLARYMQVLSDEVCDALAGRAINIHHSILPSFKGARPYHQAHDRGVKLVGATAHYVTADLDEGPIIEQEVARVTHAMTAAEVVSLGRDTEALALSRAVRWHSENRVMINGHRTVVFH